jgi:hypothetical protein
MYSFSFLAKNFEILYTGTHVFLTTDLIGLPGLCNFIRAFSAGGFGYFWVRCLTCLLCMIRLLFCSALVICFWYLLVGSLVIRWNP